MQTGIECTIYIGLPGCGKSLTQTELKVLEYLIAGEEVWCCYWINWNGPNYHYYAPGDFEAIKNLRNCVVVFDEIAQTFEPRAWDQEGSDVRRFFQLHRHRHVTIIGNTQDISLVAKTVGIIASNWYFLEANPRHWLIKWLFDPSEIRINITEMTFQQLKKMANGFELEGLMERDESIKSKNIVFKPKKILHSELNKFKIEYFHYYCPKCCMRSGGLITKEKSLEDIEKDKGKCEKCHTDLEIRESGMYDTDYEPPTIDRNRKQIWVKKIVKESWVVEGTNYAPAGSKDI